MQHFDDPCCTLIANSAELRLTTQLKMTIHTGAYVIPQDSLLINCVLRPHSLKSTV